MEGWYKHNYIPPTAAFQLTTTDCELFFPGITAYYGDEIPLDVHIKILTLGEIGITASNSLMSGVGTLEVQFWAIKEDGTTEMAI